MIRIGRWLWPAAIVIAWIVLVARGIDPRSALAGPASALQDSPWIAVALIGAFLARAVVLLPATLLTVLAGLSLGPAWGSVVALVGATASALLAYGLARGVATPTRRSAAAARETANRARPTGNPTGPATDPARPDAWPAGPRERLGAWRERFRRDAFRTTLIARLALVPGDLVNVSAGTAQVPWRPFALATLIGGTPGLIAAVFAGASLQGAFEPDAVRIGWGPLVGSLALALITVTVSVWARRRAPEAPEAAAPAAADDKPSPPNLRS